MLEMHGVVQHRGSAYKAATRPSPNGLPAALILSRWPLLACGVVAAPVFGLLLQTLSLENKFCLLSGSNGQASYGV